MQIILANPRGFCAGVDRAIEIVRRALRLFGKPIYVRHEVVHNKTVVAELQEQGAVFVDYIEQIPVGATAIFSAHGVSRLVREQAIQRGLKIFDATCPLVSKVHMEVARYSRLGQECILIGHAGHPEIEGTLGHYTNADAGIYLIETVSAIDSLTVKHPQYLAYVTQTTLSVDDTQTMISALRKKFPAIVAPKKEDICFATQNRQQAVKELAEKCDLVFVLGSVTSSNSNRLKELVERLGKPAYLIDTVEDIKPQWLVDKNTIGVTAGASAPERLVQETVSFLKSLPNRPVGDTIELSGKLEEVVFALPKELV